MKYVFYLIAILAIASIIFNLFRLDFDYFFQGESQIAAISIVAALCVVILMAIMIVSKTISEKYDSK